jgi:hypothetical protein
VTQGYFVNFLGIRCGKDVLARKKKKKSRKQNEQGYDSECLFFTHGHLLLFCSFVDGGPTNLKGNPISPGRSCETGMNPMPSCIFFGMGIIQDHILDWLYKQGKYIISDLRLTSPYAAKFPLWRKAIGWNLT